VEREPDDENRERRAREALSRQWPPG
jgi:hypothetical protein